MPPEMMIMVIPSDIMFMTAVCRTTLERFVPVRKFGEATASSTNSTMRVINGSNR